MLKPYRCHKMTVNYTVKPVVGIIVKVTRDAYKKFLAGENVGIAKHTTEQSLFRRYALGKYARICSYYNWR